MPLSAGDIAFVSYYADSPESFSFVALTSISAGDVISFTDSGVRSDTGQINPGASSVEGILDWTAPAGGVPAGTVVTISSNGIFTPSETISVSHGSVVVADDPVSLNGGSGDQLFAFTGSIASPNYLAGVNANNSDWESSLTFDSTTLSVLPTGLVDGVSAMHQTTLADNMFYSGPSSFATPAAGLAAINDFSNWTSSDGALVNSGPSSFLFCFAAGTLIASATGDRAVENLEIGDLIVTQDGRRVPVKWIGRQTVKTMFLPAERVTPVRFATGSLGNGLPHSDLTVTADHGMLVDGVICHAGALVNGTTITRVPLAEMGETYTVYHIETEAHEIILANGAPAETFIDNVSRRVFDNYAEFEAIYGDVPEMAELPYPRAMSARQVPVHIARLLGASKVA
ncbi:Hint domain-containing protein [Nioella ostreopsis]|uniref:Hint domain-containing protein n=1 Tax=Nioella ostreopsis TaxID=2448479 RepID=UPI000FD79D04|nr:Hint domain-containing protein [Nioella ostreopsis]